MNVRKRAESSTPAMPMTRFLLNFEIMNAAWHMASSGFVTMMSMQLGEYFTHCSVAARTTSKLARSRSSRLMPGLLGHPAVMATETECAVESRAFSAVNMAAEL